MPDRRNRLVRGAMIAAAVAVTAPAAASAADLTTLMAAGAAGHAPGGLTRDGNGNVWVADHLKNVCRVIPTTPGDPGGLVEELKDIGGEVQTGTLCALPGLPPAWAPVAAGKIEYDATIESFYVTGQGAAGGGVWRLHWNSATNKIDDGTAAYPSGQIVSFADPGEIAEGMAFTPATLTDAAMIDFTTKRSLNVQRVIDPATCRVVGTVGTAETPRDCTSAPALTTVGSAMAVGGMPITNLGGAIYIAEDLIGVTRIATPGGVETHAVPVLGFPPLMAMSIASDPVRGRVYVGASRGDTGADEVLAYTPVDGKVQTYQPDMTSVLALAVDMDPAPGRHGDLLIDDDPTAGAGAVDAAGASIYELPLTSLLVPETHISKGPSPFVATPAVTIGYKADRNTVDFECRLDPPKGNVLTGWAPCGPGPESFENLTDLADGPHVFEARAIDSSTFDPLVSLLEPVGAGRAARVAFKVDTVAPVATILNPEADRISSNGTMTFTFRSNEDPGAGYDCRMDDEDWASCDTGQRYYGLSKGNHVFRVRAIDEAKNVGPVAEFAFSVSGSGNTSGASVTLTVAGLPAAPTPPVINPYGPITAKARIVGRSLVVTVPPVQGARAARIVIEKKGTRRANGLPSAPQVLVSRVISLKPRAGTRFVWRPSARLLGRYVNVRSIQVLVKVGPQSWDLGAGRKAVLSSPSSIWKLGR